MSERNQQSPFCYLTICLIALAALSTSCSSGPKQQPPPAPVEIRVFGSGPPLAYLILGDSTAVNVGGTPGEGIAVQTAEHLARANSVSMKSLAVSGAQTNDVLDEQLPRLGEFRPDVVLLDVGANDVTHLTSARSLENDLQSIIEKLIEVNCDVKIVVTGAPDMTTPPRIPRLLRGIAGWRTDALNKVFRREVERYGLTFAPIAEETGPLFRKDRSLFSDDEFHPNARGYQTWVDVINPALDRALESQPGHCERAQTSQEHRREGRSFSLSRLPPAQPHGSKSAVHSAASARLC